MEILLNLAKFWRLNVEQALIYPKVAAEAVRLNTLHPARKLIDQVTPTKVCPLR